ncbi:hypothetical protein H0H81_007001 [Sphagnurus paluster]|uniref:T6SS Phospholipase effector Tle1-like catalytic domain-containing protein n=1 Tax=Sphagnurus paluster TaxID=117069 RepID=A0A9P7FRB5_9AGAR|nr:hypothetical protein H0H81_007001 [Sphagnurus paluster]
MSSGVPQVGLLSACNHQQVPFAYKMYSRVDDLGWKQSNAFKEAFSVDVTIEFFGVGDTVVSVGLIPHRLPFTTSNKIVRTLRHAVSLDERRAKFKANLWNCPTAKEATLGVEGQKPDAPQKSKVKSNSLNNKVEAREEDVGGGSVENGTPNILARISLRWMIRECFKAETGIMFVSDSLREVGLDPGSLYPYVLPRPPSLSAQSATIQLMASATPAHQQVGSVGTLVDIHVSEEEHELRDALSPIYDQLSLSWLWWSLELLPMKQRFQKSDNSWGSYMGANLGRGRFIPRQKKGAIKVHRSVKLRMDAQYPDGTKYKPQASFDTALAMGNLRWVD